MVRRFYWDRSCGLWNEAKYNPYKIVSYNEISELDAIFNRLVKKCKKDNIIPDVEKLKKQSIVDWAKSENIKIRYFLGCVGQAQIAHRVKCLTVVKNGDIWVLHGVVKCGAHYPTSNDEVCESINSRGIFFIHQHHLKNHKFCSRCNNT